jgi:hypothetical protein
MRFRSTNSVVFAHAKPAERRGSVRTAGCLDKVAERAHNTYNKYEGMHPKLTSAEGGLVDEKTVRMTMRKEYWVQR